MKLFPSDVERFAMPSGEEKMMTPEERAARFAMVVDRLLTPDLVSAFRQCHADARAEGYAAAREEDAKLVETYKVGCSTRQELAAAIRALTDGDTHG